MTDSLEFVRLRVSGFKSFCDATELEIGHGLTGIVGPNGCGKSNIVEALRWVMGESSAKGLRGGEMDDVIFGGSAMRAPFDLAEVALGLKRPPQAPGDGAVHVLPNSEELEISRRIGRGTGSLFRLNGREVRARDIQLLFADAGAGSKSPAIVGQGQVGFIVEAKPEERRRLLEEAAGIGGMHSRRREAELKLAATQGNLERITDQLGLLAERHTALGKQAREAERYKKLQGQIRALDAWLVLARITGGRAALEAAREALVSARRRLGEERAKAEAAETAHDAAASRLPALRDRAGVALALRARLAERVEQADREAARVAAERARLEADRDEAASRIAALGEAIDSGNARHEVILATDRKLASTVEALQAERAASGPSGEAASLRLQGLEREMQEAGARRAELERRLEGARARHEERHRRLRSVEGELRRLADVADDALVEAASRRRDEAEALLARADAGLGAALARRAGTVAPEDRLQGEVEAAGEAARQAAARVAALDAEIARRRTALSGLADRRQWHERALAQALAAAAEAEDSLAGLLPEDPDEDARLEVTLAGLEARSVELEEAVATASAHVAGVRERLAPAERALAEHDAERIRLAAEAAALASIETPRAAAPVLDLLRVREGGETPLAAALGDDLMAGLDREAAAHWRHVPTESPEPALPEGVRSLAGLVEAPPALRRRLSQIGLVGDAATAARLLPTLAQGQRLVTPDGGLWRWDGFVRQAEADDALRRRLAQRQRRQALERRLAGLDGERGTLARTVGGLTDELGRLELGEKALLAERAELLPAIERAARVLESAAVTRQHQRAERQRLTEAATRAAAERAEHERALAALRVAGEEQALDEVVEELAAARATLLEREGVATGLAADLAAARKAHAAAALDVERAEADQRRAAQEALAARLLHERRQSEAEMRKSHRTEAVAGLEAEARQLRGELEALDATSESDTTALAAAAGAFEQLKVAFAEAGTLAERLRTRRAALDAEERSALDQRRALADELAHLVADLDRRAADLVALRQRLRTLEEALTRAVAATDGGDPAAALRGELEATEREAGEAAAALAAAEAELLACEARRRTAEGDLARAHEAAALARAETERLGLAQTELERETARRLGQPIEAALAAAGESGIERSLEGEPPAVLEARLEKLKVARERLGAVNLRAAQECEELAAEIGRLEREAGELREAIGRLQRAIATLNREARGRLETVFQDVDRHFRHLFQRLFGGGKAHLRLTSMDDPLNAGLELEAMPPGKKLQNIRLLSGGEKSLTALALVFAFFLTQPSPLCVLDEVDAALDDANVERFADLLEEMAKETRTRFLVVTHHPLTMARMDRLFGVTMAERGVSRLVSVAFDEAERLRATA